MEECSAWRRAGVIGLASLLAAGLLACGGGDEARPSGPAMGAGSAGASRTAGSAPDRASRDNEPPEIQRLWFEPSAPAAGEPVRIVVEAFDPDGDSLHLGYLWTLEGQPLPEGGPKIELGRIAHRGDTIAVRVVASDGQDESEPAFAKVAVRNREPILRGVALQPAGPVSGGTRLLAAADAHDADDDELEFTYTWFVNGEEVLSGEEPRFDTRGLGRGSRVRAQVIVSDGEDTSLPLDTAVVQISNSPPEIVSVPGAVDGSGRFDYVVEAEDPDGDRPLRYRLARAPDGMEIDVVDARITWEPRDDQKGRHVVEVVVEDRHGGSAMQTFDITVGAAEPAAAPAAAAD